MKSTNKWVITIVLTVLLSVSVLHAGWQIQENTISQTANKNALFQLAAFNTFSTGQYAGVMTYKELAENGDFGIGTFDGLDGEMIALNGVFYQIPSTGISQEADPTQTAPYATITYFQPTQTYEVSDLDYAGLRAFLDEKFTSEAIYAIKVHGTYSIIEARSPLKQAEPYPNITDALKTQSLFNFTDISATAVGFYFPESMNGVDYAGYHLHVITDDHAAGGHILDCQIEQATVEIDVIKQYNLVFP